MWDEEESSTGEKKSIDWEKFSILIFHERLTATPGAVSAEQSITIISRREITKRNPRGRNDGGGFRAERLPNNKTARDDRRRRCPVKIDSERQCRDYCARTDARLDAPTAAYDARRLIILYGFKRVLRRTMDIGVYTYVRD